MLETQKIVYKKSCDKPLTIIFEPINTFFRFIDPSEEFFNLDPQYIVQFNVEKNNANNEKVKSLLTLQYCDLALEKVLRQYSSLFELILFTALPKCVLDSFFKQTSCDLTKYFSHIIAQEDAV